MISEPQPPHQIPSRKAPARKTAAAGTTAIANDNVAETFTDRFPRALGGLPDIPGGAAAPSLRWAPGGAARLFWLLFLLLVLSQVTGAFIAVHPAIQAAMSITRRVIWLMTLVFMIHETVRAEPLDLLGPMKGFMPYFLVGLASALLGVEPGTGLVDLSFWLITMIGACVIGKQFRGRNLPAGMMAWFALTLGLSILLALVAPKLAVDVDNRTISGAWRGVFPGKNWLAWYAGFGLVLAGFGGSVRVVWRLGLGLISAVALHAAHSAGGTASVAVVFGAMMMFAFWRRLGLSPGLQAAINGLIVTLVVVGGALGYQVLLAAMGRDVTLTGRTLLWKSYFGRALDSWLIGAGPGSFTELSLTTQDISLRYQWVGKIFTPHNMYLAVFGEVGILGLIAYIVPLLMIAFHNPLRQDKPGRNLLPAFALYFLVSGLDETHDVFGVCSGIFMILLLRAWQWPELHPRRRGHGSAPEADGLALHAGI
jgi:exopolysaccharide production protein ExoQ